MNWKNILGNNGWKPSKFGKRHKPIDSRCSANLNRKTSKKSICRHIITTLLKTNDKEKILKASREKLHYLFEWVQIFHRKPWRPKEMTHFFEVLTENNTRRNLEYKNEERAIAMVNIWINIINCVLLWVL